MTRRNIQFKTENGVLMMGKNEPIERVDKGACYFCNFPVYASEGQLLTHFRGKPTHKKCRRLGKRMLS